MRVCHFSTNHNAFDTRILWKQCVSLSRAGYEVSLVCQLKESNSCDEVDIIVFPQLRPRLIRMTLGPWLMLWKVLKTKSEIYHFHDPELLFIGILLRWITKKPVIFDVHEDNVTVIRQRTYIPTFLRKPLERLYVYFESLGHKYLSIVIAEKYYSRRLPKGIPILNYPIIDRAIQGASKEAPNAIYSDAAPHWFIYTGSVRKDRGAIHHAKIVSQHEKVGVLSAGICSESLAAEMLLCEDGSKRLRMEGVGDQKVSRSRLDELTQSYDWIAGLALFPKSDHFAEKELTKFFEYMRDGVAILCSDMPAWKQFVEKNRVGLAVDPNDEAAVKKAIEYLIENPDERREMGRRGRKLVNEIFNWEVEAGKLIALYRELTPTG